jgi:hypothetical protein
MTAFATRAWGDLGSSDGFPSGLDIVVLLIDDINLNYIYMYDEI